MKSLSYLISHMGQMHELLARKIRVFFNSSVDNGFHGLYMVLPGNCKGALSWIYCIIHNF